MPAGFPASHVCLPMVLLNRCRICSPRLGPQSKGTRKNPLGKKCNPLLCWFIFNWRNLWVSGWDSVSKFQTVSKWETSSQDQLIQLMVYWASRSQKLQALPNPHFQLHQTRSCGDTGTAPRASTCLVSLTSLLSAWVSGANSSIGEFISNDFQNHDSKPVRKSLQVSPLMFRPTLAAELAAVLSHLNVAFEPQENLQPCGGQEHGPKMFQISCSLVLVTKPSIINWYPMWTRSR